MLKVQSVIKYVWSHPANRNHRVRAIARAIGWQIRKRLLRGPHDINVFGGLNIRCYSDSPSASLVIYCNECPDYHEMLFMRRYLRSGDSVLDIGANIGVYTLLAVSQVGPAGQVLAFEPAPEAYRRLSENIQINRLNNVKMYACALGDREGFVDFLNQYDTTNRIKTVDDLGKSVVSVPLARLDDIVDINCAFGKMDIEGAEPVALHGAKRLLQESNPPIWLLEINGLLHAFGFTEDTFSDWLSLQGYDLGLYDADRHELSFIHDRPWELSPNVFAVARNRKLLVAERCGARLVDL